MTKTCRIGVAVVLGFAAPVLAGEVTDTEHDTYEKRSMKIETGVMPTTTTLPPSRVYEHHDESESTTIERHSTTPPATTMRKQTRDSTESVETKEKN